jgi:hypothetical protein
VGHDALGELNRKIARDYPGLERQRAPGVTN